MLEVAVALPPRASLAGIEKIVEAECARAGLRLTLKGTLAAYPGCVHWHFKRGLERGALEITFWKTEQRLWFKAAAGRTARWMDEALPKLRRAIVKKLKSKR